jgi:hypothetical protein
MAFNSGLKGLNRIYTGQTTLTLPNMEEGNCSI